MDLVRAPWTETQVNRLNLLQQQARNPLLCGYRGDHYSVNPGILVAERTGWVCPYRGCDYEQEWTPRAMLENNDYLY